MPGLNSSQRIDIPRGAAGNYEGFMRTAGPKDTATFFFYVSEVITTGAAAGAKKLTIEGCPEIKSAFALDIVPNNSGDPRVPSIHLISDISNVKIVYFKL